IALDHIDEIIAIIRGSRNGEEARPQLMERFNLSERQAQAILDMRLVRLSGLEREKIEAEYQELQILIGELKAILADEEKVLEIIRTEIAEVKERFNDNRRTEITAGGLEMIEDEDLIPRENSVITLTHNGYIKRLAANTYRSQKRGGRGVQGMGTNEDDFVEHLLFTSTHDTILFFTSKGKVFRAKGYEIPEYGRQAKGLPIVNLLNIDKEEKVTAMIRVAEFKEDAYFIFTTKTGVTKRTPVIQFANIRTNGLIAITLRDDDDLISVHLTDGTKEIIIGTSDGMLVRFKEEDIRSMGRTAAGVRGIKLREGDHVVGMEILEPEQEILVVTEKGYGKRTPEAEYRLQSRGGLGLKTMQITEKNGKMCAVKAVDGTEDIMLITINGMLIRMDVKDISVIGRSTQGVRLIRLAEEEYVATVARVKKDDDTSEIDEEEEEVDSE
ncbi:MAG: DNA gyrase C-terminal beta-propeller domain-containing protein, partial [Anaerorhabdus sp.]